MKALTLTQPWASAIALGLKRVETRSWKTAYRGPIAIHAAKGFPAFAREFAETERALGRLPRQLPLSSVVAIARLVDIRPTAEIRDQLGDLERLYGDFGTGRYAWLFDGIEELGHPVPARGALGLWEWAAPADLGPLTTR